MKTILLFLLSTNAIADTSKVYSNDSEGLKTYGEKSKLVDSVMNGKRISLLIHIPSNDSKQAFFPDRVFVNSDNVYAEVPLIGINHKYGQMIDFRLEKYPAAAVFGTDGKEIVKVDEGTFVNKFNIDWFVIN